MLRPVSAALSQPPPEPDPSRIDQRVILHGQRFRDYEVLLALRGESSGVRLYFLEGSIELMSPSIDHEAIEKTLGRLFEAWAEERGVDVNGYGSWTLKSEPDARGAEPDECDVLGGVRKERPDLAIEVQWTRGGLDKLEIYRGLGVREVWIWRRAGAIDVHVLRGDAYVSVERSELLPDLDLAQLARFLPAENQTQAVRAYRAALRGG